jgi:hypothetical protein
MMRHVFEKNDGRIMIAQNQIIHNYLPIILHRRDHFFRAGMILTRRRFGKIVGVQRLIEDTRIIPLGERIHQRSGYIARTTPQTDARNILIHDCLASFAARTAR